MLDLVAAEMGIQLGARDLTALRHEMTALGAWEGSTDLHRVAAAQPAGPAQGEAVLATWHHLLDSGSMQDGEPFLAGTAPRSVARISAGTAESVGLTEGAHLAVSTERGTISLPVELTEMPDHVVWVPTNSPGSAVRATLGAEAGSIVAIAAGQPAAGTTASHTATGGHA